MSTDLLFTMQNVTVRRVPSGLLVYDKPYAWKATFWIVAISYLGFIAIILGVANSINKAESFINSQHDALTTFPWDSFLLVTAVYLLFLWLYVKRETLIEPEKERITLNAYRLMTRARKRVLAFAAVDCLQLRKAKYNGNDYFEVCLRSEDGAYLPICDRFTVETYARDLMQCVSAESGIAVDEAIVQAFL